MTNLTNLVEILAKQALGGSQQNNQQQSGGLGGILGSVLGQVINQQTQQRPQQNTQAGGLGGILGSVLGQLGGGGNTTQSGGGKSALLVAVLPIVLAWIQKQGGIQGALSKLQKSGFSSQVNSWVSPEDHVQNEEIQPEQLQMLFDDADIDEVAQQTHQPKQNVYSALATALPQIIDALTPDGDNTNKQEADNDIQDVMQSISNLLLKR